MIGYYLGGIPIWMGTWWKVLPEKLEEGYLQLWKSLMFYVYMSWNSTRDRWENRRWRRR